MRARSRLEYDPHSQRAKPPSPATTLPVRVRALGEVAGQPFHSTAGTYYDDAMLTVVVSGRGWFQRRGERVGVGAGDVGLVWPDPRPRDERHEPHSPLQNGLLLADPSRPYRHLYCRFGGGVALDLAKRIAAQRGRPGGGFFACPEAPELTRGLRRMMGFGHVHIHQPLTDEQSLTPADGFLLHLLALLAASPPRPTERLGAASLREYLVDHLAEPFDLQAMASAFGLSKSHLCRVGRSSLGRTIGQEAVAIKMAWARDLLREPGLRIREVAARVGYLDPLYFSRVFAEHTGLSPRSWRRRRGPEDVKASNPIGRPSG